MVNCQFEGSCDDTVEESDDSEIGSEACGAIQMMQYVKSELKEMMDWRLRSTPLSQRSGSSYPEEGKYVKSAPSRAENDGCSDDGNAVTISQREQMLNVVVAG